MTVQRRADLHRHVHQRGLQNDALVPPVSNLLHAGSRRWFLQAGLAGAGGLVLPRVLEGQSPGAGAA
ncbi:MAG: hypothetical protein KY476_23275 [Planctomycetes bacterium]|nr:hypothetical protein [Planctomycetota bacterium]